MMIFFGIKRKICSFASSGLNKNDVTSHRRVSTRMRGSRSGICAA
jgi:hypothetical protein